MISSDILKNKIESIDGKDYGACQSLLGAYEYPNFNLHIDQIPKDPYAPPHTGIYRVQVSCDIVPMPQGLEDSKVREVAFRDFLARKFFAASSNVSKTGRGTGFSGIITIDEPGQCILERSSVVINKNINWQIF